MYQNNSVTVGADKRGDNKSKIIYYPQGPRSSMDRIRVS